MILGGRISRGKEFIQFFIQQALSAIVSHLLWQSLLSRSLWFTERVGSLSLKSQLVNLYSFSEPHGLCSYYPALPWELKDRSDNTWSNQDGCILVKLDKNKWWAGFGPGALICQPLEHMVIYTCVFLKSKNSTVYVNRYFVLWGLANYL